MTSSVYIAKNVYGGDGLGRLGDGRVAFVPGAWAGEHVRADIVEEKKHFVKAKLVEILESSPDRLPEDKRPPAMPGMVYAGLDYKAECRAKEAQLKEFLDRARIPFGEFRPFDPASASQLGYRNKVVYHFARRGNGWAIGYRAEPSHEIVDVESDPLARPEINAKLPEIRRAVVTLLTTGPEAVRRDTERKGGVTVRWTKKTGVKWWIGDTPPGLVLKETTAGLDFEVPADGFYQVNPEVGEMLAQTVVGEYEKGASAAPDVVDLYCGVGVFGLCSLKNASDRGCPMRLFGVESGRQAVDFARRNAASQGARDAKFFAWRVGQSLRRIPAGPGTTVVVDPPRGGLERGVARWLAGSRAPRIIYVSCDPATLVRDLRELSSSYAAESVGWFNMFPRTARFETVVTLARKNS